MIHEGSYQEAADVYEQDGGDATKGDPLEHGAIFSRVVAVGIIGLVSNAQSIPDGHRLGLPQIQEREDGHRAFLPGEQNQAEGQGWTAPVVAPASPGRAKDGCLLQGLVGHGDPAARGQGEADTRPRVPGRVYRE